MTSPVVTFLCAQASSSLVYACFFCYFVAPVDPSSIPSNPDERFGFCMRTPGCIELTWNYGSEAEEGAVYNTGNGDTTGTQDGQKVRGGFGHIGVTVPDVYEVRRFYSQHTPIPRRNCRYHSIRPNLVPCFNFVLSSIEHPAHAFGAPGKLTACGEGI